MQSRKMITHPYTLPGMAIFTCRQRLLLLTVVSSPCLLFKTWCLPPTRHDSKLHSPLSTAIRTLPTPCDVWSNVMSFYWTCVGTASATLQWWCKPLLIYPQFSGHSRSVFSTHDSLSGSETQGYSLCIVYGTMCTTSACDRLNIHGDSLST